MRDEESHQEETYEQAVVRAGVIELADAVDLLAGRCEANDPPEAPR